MMRDPARPVETTASSERQSHELRKRGSLAASKAAETLIHLVTFFLSLIVYTLSYAERLLSLFSLCFSFFLLNYDLFKLNFK